MGSYTVLLHSVYKQLVLLKWSVGGLEDPVIVKYSQELKPDKFPQAALWLINTDLPKQFIPHTTHDIFFKQ